LGQDDGFKIVEKIGTDAASDKGNAKSGYQFGYKESGDKGKNCG